MRIEGGPAIKGRPLRALLAVLLVVVVGFVSFAAAVGPSVAVYWVWTYLVPPVVGLGVLFGAFWLLLRDTDRIAYPFRSRRRQ